MMGSKTFFYYSFSLLLVGGCCHLKRGYPPPNPKNLVNAIRKRNTRAKSLKAVVKADQFTKKGRIKLKVFLLVKQGGKLRFEATVVDNTVAVLASNGVKFTSIDFKKHIVYEGPASPCNISRVFNIPLTGEQVAVVLMGGVPVLIHDKVGLSWDKCKGHEVLILYNKRTEISQKIYLKKKGKLWQVLGTRIRDKKGKTLLKVVSRGFRRRGGVWVARWIQYVHPKRKADLLMRFQSQKVNVAIPEEAFSLNPPQGLKRRWLQCPPFPALPFEAVGKRLKKSFEKIPFIKNGRPPSLGNGGNQDPHPAKTPPKKKPPVGKNTN